MSEPEDPPIRNAKGQFLPGYCPPVRRAKGTKNKIPKTVKGALKRAVENIGLDGKGTDADVGFFEMVGRKNPERLGDWYVHATVPKAKEEENESSGPPQTVVIQIWEVPSGCFLTKEAIARYEKTGSPMPVDDTNVVPLRPKLVTINGRTEEDGAA